MDNELENITDDELLDNDEEIEEAHDMMNAETKSNDSVRKAAATGPKAKKRKGDKETAGTEKSMPKLTNKGFVRELYNRMNEMSTEELSVLHSIVMEDNFLEAMENMDEEDMLEDVEYDLQGEISDLVESEATLSEDFKAKSLVIMEAAVKSKVREEAKRLEEAYAEQLDEEIAAIEESMEEMINGYLDYVVETWMEENKLAVESGLRTEIAENFMSGLKDLFEESYISVPEDKVDLLDDIVERAETLEAELNESIEAQILMAEELEGYQRDAIIVEMASDLADTQVDKLISLAEGVDFDDEETFREKLSIIKETHFAKKTNKHSLQLDESADDDTDTEMEVSPMMETYLTALRKNK